MIEEKDYDEVFHKDDRSKRGTDNYKKRANVKEVRLRQVQQEKRKLSGEDSHSDEQT